MGIDVRARASVLPTISVPLVAGTGIAAARSRGVTNHGLFDSPASHLSAALLTVIVLGAGLWIIAATGRATRWLHPTIKLPLLILAVMAAVMLVDPAALIMLTAPLAAFPGIVHRLALVAAVLASLTRLLFAGRAASTWLTTTPAA